MKLYGPWFVFKFCDLGGAWGFVIKIGNYWNLIPIFNKKHKP